MDKRKKERPESAVGDCPASRTRSKVKDAFLSWNLLEVADSASASAPPLPSAPSSSTVTAPSAGPGVSTGAIRKAPKQQQKKKKKRRKPEAAPIQTVATHPTSTREVNGTVISETPVVFEGRAKVSDLKRPNLPPEAPGTDSTLFTTCQRDGILTNVYQLRDQEDLASVAVDKSFPPEYSSMMIPEQTEAELKHGIVPENPCEWIPPEAVRRNASLFPELPKEPLSAREKERLKARLRERIRHLRQGELGDCWLAVAIFLLGYFYGYNLYWILSHQQSQHYYSVLLRLLNNWVMVHVHMLFPGDLLDGLKFMQPVERRYLFASVIELALAKAYGCFCRLEQGLVSIGIAHMIESYAVFHQPHLYTPLGLANVIYAALLSGRLISLGSKKWVFGEPLVSPDMPSLLFDHALAVMKMYLCKFKGQPVVLLLCRDPHGVRRRGPLCPTGNLFRFLDRATRREIMRDFSIDDEGLVVLPIDVLPLRFSFLEEIGILPPRPSSLDENIMVLDWSDMLNHMQLYHGVWGNVPAEGYHFQTPAQRARVVCQVTNTNIDLSSRAVNLTGLDVVEQDTGRVVIRAEPMALNRVSLTFWSDGPRRYFARPTSVQRYEPTGQTGSFEVEIISMVGSPEDQRIREQFTCEPGELTARLTRTLNMPRPAPPAANSSDQDIHGVLWDHFWAPEDLKEEEVEEEEKEEEDDEEDNDEEEEDNEEEEEEEEEEDEEEEEEDEEEEEEDEEEEEEDEEEEEEDEEEEEEDEEEEEEDVEEEEEDVEEEEEDVEEEEEDNGEEEEEDKEEEEEDEEEED